MQPTGVFGGDFTGSTTRNERVAVIETKNNINAYGHKD